MFASPPTFFFFRSVRQPQLHFLFCAHFPLGSSLAYFGQVLAMSPETAVVEGDGLAPRPLVPPTVTPSSSGEVLQDVPSSDDTVEAEDLMLEQTVGGILREVEVRVSCLFIPSVCAEIRHCMNNLDFQFDSSLIFGAPGASCTVSIRLWCCGKNERSTLTDR